MALPRLAQRHLILSSVVGRYFNYGAVVLYLFLCVDHGAYSAGQGNS